MWCLTGESKNGAQGIARLVSPSSGPYSVPCGNRGENERSVRIVTCEENLHGRLLSERVEDFQTLTLRQEAFGWLRPALSSDA